jgi:hypothetical protein
MITVREHAHSLWRSDCTLMKLLGGGVVGVMTPGHPYHVAQRGVFTFHKP